MLNDGNSQLRDSWVIKNSNFSNESLTDDQMKYLRTKWDRACNVLWDTHKVLEPSYHQRRNKAFNNWFDRLVCKYSEKQRKYHTLIHLLEMFQYLDLTFNSMNEICDEKEEYYHALVMAIFFHDAVYDPRSNSNEDDSAILYLNFVADVCSEQNGVLHDRISKYIIATKHHIIPDSFSNDIYLKLFLDIDMSVLAKTSDAYWAYSSSIRQEYLHVNHDVYCSKRSEILTNFLSVGFIFHTDLMRRTFEGDARKNLNEEIRLLIRGCIPNQSTNMLA